MAAPTALRPICLFNITITEQIRQIQIIGSDDFKMKYSKLKWDFIGLTKQKETRCIFIEKFVWSWKLGYWMTVLYYWKTAVVCISFLLKAHVCVCAWVCVCVHTSLTAPACSKNWAMQKGGEERQRDNMREIEWSGRCGGWRRVVLVGGGGGGSKRKKRDCQRHTNSQGSMSRLQPAYPRERQTQSSSRLQFKVVTRPLEFLILIASTGPRLQHRERTCWKESRPLLTQKERWREHRRKGEGEREITIYCSFYSFIIQKSAYCTLCTRVLKSSILPRIVETPSPPSWLLYS